MVRHQIKVSSKVIYRQDCSFKFILTQIVQTKVKEKIGSKLDSYHVPGQVPKNLPCKISEMPNHIPFVFTKNFTSHNSFI